MAVVLSFGLLACEDSKKDGRLDLNTVYSDITNSLKLDLNYENKHFINDGVGSAKLTSVTDGDTAAFELPDGTKLRVRFYGINTPESTGKVEKWGKAASIFLKDILLNASEIVLESSTGKKAVTDNYGERYLGYVWYRNSSNEDFKNVNLLLVENGYTPSNCINTLAYKYYTTFEKAEKFAEKGALRIWGYANDIYYTTDPIEATLKELNENPYAYFNEELDAGSKVIFKATVISLKEGDTGTHLWKLAQIIDGEVYTFDLYTGYASDPLSSYLTIGHEYNFEAFVDEHYGSWQLQGAVYLLGKKGLGYTYLTKLRTAIFLSDSTAYTPKYVSNLKTAGTITEAVLDGNDLKLTVSFQTKQEEGLGEATTQVIRIEGVGSSYNTTNLLNKKLVGTFFLGENNEYYAPNINNVTFK